VAEAIADVEAASTEKSKTHVEPKLLGMLAKDLAIIFAALSLWAAADTWYEVTGLMLAQVVSVADGIFVGYLLASLFHEWGHYAGTLAAGGSATRFYPKGFNLFRFNFNFAANDVRQFHWMTYGGHVLHWSIFIILVVMLPLDSLGRRVLVASVFGFITFASVIEYNIIKDTWAGADPQTRLRQLNAKDFQQATVIGTLGGLFALAFLS